MSQNHLVDVSGSLYPAHYLPTLAVVTLNSIKKR